ncbi:DUF3276 family protein [Marinilabilia salmonicolor]|jgi:hypothetical protein|uniref:Uncharacterized protein DUF3276 n=1 Tax=Marinilabilia salmonicolor TaxID=989 RepID=A0A2T0WTX2_9BACT|nr:DUF3276 family protein [Marinilabilia salmonicolor]PRY90014.1 uncharacterized protein DUF3276 [Marinilabilia salmonicolor]RCW28825.1 uncharacterized protein DUF3276 [Marinilabilia salmonicolor]
MEGFDKKDDFDKKRNDRDDIFSKAVRAGKRTYFFDVKATRKNDYYLTITESKKRFEDDGRFRFEKHKLFLYKEDFAKFADGLKEVIDFIQAEQGVYTEEGPKEEEQETADSLSAAEYTNVDFEDLSK